MSSLLKCSLFTKGYLCNKTVLTQKFSTFLLKNKRNKFINESTNHYSFLSVAGLLFVLSLQKYCGAEDIEVDGSSQILPNGGGRMRLSRQTTHGLSHKKDSYDFVIIGVNTTADAAIEGILAVCPDAEILVLSSEPQLPRISLRKQELSADLTHTYNQWRRHVIPRFNTGLDQEESAKSLTLLLARDSVRIDIENRRLLLSNEKIYFDKALLATSARPRDLYVLDGVKALSSSTKIDRVNALHNLADFEILDSLFDDKESTGIQKVTVIGGGFLGTELVLALAQRGKQSGAKIYQLFAEPLPLQNYLPPYLSLYLSKCMKEQGIEHITERICTKISDSENSDGLHLKLVGLSEENFETDYVVLASTHVVPQVEVARASGLEIDQNNGGIVVNSQLEASGGIYAAGSCASFYDPTLGRRRVDRFDHSINSGFLAGLNMALTSSRYRASADSKHKTGQNPNLGNQRIYSHQPVFKSSIPSIGVEIEVVGEINSGMKSVGIWVDRNFSNEARLDSRAELTNFHRGIVYYMKDNKIHGILLWNAPDLLDGARGLLHGQPNLSVVNANQLKRLLPVAPDTWLHVKECVPFP